MIDLPKKDKQGIPFLSYSQIASWLRNKKDYMRKYFLNEKDDFTAYLDFGLKIGQALETNDFSAFSDEEKQLLQQIPRFDEFETPITLNFPEHGFYIMGYIDSNKADKTQTLEYKTGALNKVEEYTKETYIQPHIYVMALEQMYGKKPEKATVVLIERNGNAFKGEPLYLGKETVHIDVDISPERIEYAKELILKTAQEISHYWKVFKKLNNK